MREGSRRQQRVSPCCKQAHHDGMPHSIKEEPNGRAQHQATYLSALLLLRVLSCAVAELPGSNAASLHDLWYPELAH